MIRENSKKKPHKRRKKRPNIVFIISDDHAYQAISAYGGRLAEVEPIANIDRMAEDGMLFNHALVTNSICGPSRATIMTDPNEMNNIYGDPDYAAVQKELHKELEELRVKYDDNDSLNEKFIEEYKEKVKTNPLVEYRKLEPEELQRLYQEYLKSQR